MGLLDPRCGLSRVAFLPLITNHISNELTIELLHQAKKVQRKENYRAANPRLFWPNHYLTKAEEQKYYATS